MVTVLAIETSTDACSVALAHDNIVQENFLVCPRQHHNIILPMINDLMEGLQLNFKDLDCIAYGQGPGSFTGLRLGAGVVQGLAFAAQKNVIGISSLAAIAWSASLEMAIKDGQRIRVVRDARMGEFYVGTYVVRGEAVVAEVEDMLVSHAQLAEAVEKDMGVLWAGDSWQTEAMTLQSPLESRYRYPHARAILALALPSCHSGLGKPAHQALPKYVRESVAWRKWQPKRRQDF